MRSARDTTAAVGTLGSFFTPAQRYVSALCAMDLCLSATSRCCVETDEHVQLDFGTQASFNLSYMEL